MVQANQMVLYGLTGIFVLANLVVSAAYLVEGFFSRVASRLVGVTLAKRTLPDRLYTAVWITAGLFGVWASGPPAITAAIGVFLAFKSGADLGSRVIYGLHDLSLLGEGSTLTRAVGNAMALAATPSVLFLMLWGMLQQWLSGSVAKILGLSVDLLTLCFWGLGVLFGMAFGAIRCRGERGLLLGGELALVLGLGVLEGVRSGR